MVAEQHGSRNEHSNTDRRGARRRIQRTLTGSYREGCAVVVVMAVHVDQLATKQVLDLLLEARRRKPGVKPHPPKYQVWGASALSAWPKPFPPRLLRVSPHLSSPNYSTGYPFVVSQRRPTDGARFVGPLAALVDNPPHPPQVGCCSARTCCGEESSL